MSRKRKYLVRKAANRVRSKLKRRDRIVDLRNRRLSEIDPQRIAKARGFLINLRIYGRTIIVKPAEIAFWIRDSVGMIEVVKELARRGRLIRGCDGKLTRQVQIDGRRQRYFCFPVGEKIRAEDHPVRRKTPDQRRSLFGRANRDHELLKKGRDDMSDTERMRPERPVDADGDMSDWSDESDRPGIGVVQTVGWAPRFVEDWSRRKTRTRGGDDW